MSIITPNTRPGAPSRYISTFGPGDCDCCDPTNPCACCPDTVCTKSMKITLTNLAVDFFGTVYNLAGPYCLTVWARSTISPYTIRRWCVEVATDIWVEIEIGGSIFCCTTTEQMNWDGIVSIRVMDIPNLRLGSAIVYQRPTDMSVACYDCASFVTTDTSNFDVDFDEKDFDGENCGATSDSGNMTGTVTVADGDCGDGATCCEYTCDDGETLYCAQGCCTDGTNWFCDPEPMPFLFATFVSGSCSIWGAFPIIPLSDSQINGICMIYEWTFAGGAWIACDGTVYGYRSAAGTYDENACGQIWPAEIVAIGSVTTVTSCDPVDVTVTITDGPCAGVWNLTE